MVRIKKISIYSFIFLLFTFMIGCSMYYTYENNEPGLSIAYNSKNKDAFIGTYTWGR